MKDMTGNKKMDKGELIVVCGRPASGRTVFLTTMIRDANSIGIKSQVFSLELLSQHIKERIGNEKDIDYSKIEIFDDYKCDNQILERKIRENVDIVFIDYLQLLGDDIINKEKKLLELKDIAQRKNVTIIVIGQVSRKMESILPKERLCVSWLKKHSNAWEYYLFDSIDRLIYVDRYEKRLNNKKLDDLEKVDVHVVKNKGTALGTIEYVFKKKPLKFEFTSDSKKVFYERYDGK